MIRNAWYAVCAAKDLSQQPMKVTIHGMDFVLFRDDEGTPHAADAFCPHRGCDLSLGSVQSGHLVCPFHGWTFRASGECTAIPANRKQVNIPIRARLTVYPACQAVDLIWIYTDAPATDDTQTPPEHETFAQLRQSSWRYIPFRQTWQAHFTRVVESVLDVSHLPFVHPETSGTDVNPVVDGPEYHVTPTGILIYPQPFASSHPMEPVISPPEANARTEIELQFPNQWMIRTPFGNDGWICTFLTFTPVNDQVTDIFGIILRNFDHDAAWLDEFHMEHTLKVMGEDKVIIESLRPRQAPFDLHAEVHVASDAPTVRYRAMLRGALRREGTARSSL